MLTVEVIYLENGKYQSRKWLTYPTEKAKEVFKATVRKFKKEKTSALVGLRDATDTLIRCERT
jgi:hypothetical protein